MKKNIRCIYTYTLFTNMLFVLPVLMPFYNHIGLSFRDFLIGEAVFAAVVFAAEVPSGWISDMWSRRTTLMLGALVGMAGYTTLMFSHDLFTASLAQAIIGIAVALNSGTNTAILYDGLLEEGRTDEYRRLDSTRQSCCLYGVAISATAGGFLFKIDPQLPLLFDILTTFAAMVTIWRVREPVRHTRSVEKHLFRDMWETMKYAIHGHADVGGIIIVSAILMTSTKLMFWLQQPYYADVGIAPEWYGVILTGSYIVGGFLSQMGHHLDKHGSARGFLIFMSVCLVLSCVVLAVFPSAWLAVPLFLVGTLTWGMGQPRINDAINSQVGSERRATILSTGSLMVQILFVPTSLVVGYVSDHEGVSGGLLWVAGQIMILGFAGFWLWGKRSYAASSSMTGT